MHKDLDKAFESVVASLRNDDRCLGGWHYGSVGRGMGDEYSDYDPVYLVRGTDFESFCSDVPGFVSSASDELLICWPEDYNDSCFRNYCNVIRMGGNLHQLDFFVMNFDRLDAWFCRQHLKGCTRSNIIFDRTGEVSALLDRGLRTDNNIPDAARAMDTYWFHATMLIKYFKRRDMFKLLKNIDFLFHAHIDLLLSRYDSLDWGAWETKVKHCVPDEKQAHLLGYFTPADFSCLEAAMNKCMQYFREDAEEICQYQGIAYPERVAELTVEHFNRRMSSDTW